MLNNIGGVTIGTIVAYLQFTKSFTQPFMQVSQQFNSIIMALAGAERIFNMMDEAPEVDDGYVTLVNAQKGSEWKYHRVSGADRAVGLEASPSGGRHRHLHRAEGRCAFLRYVLWLYP